MRARTVKPEFFRDKKMGQLGPVVALVYQALWVSADDYGCARADAEQLKGDMFTYWPSISCADIAQALQTLAHCKRIACYRIEDDVFARILRWDDHQKVHMPGKFRYPRGGTPLSPEALNPFCAGPAQPCADTASPLLHYSTTPVSTRSSTETQPDQIRPLAVARSSSPNGATRLAAAALLPISQDTDRRERRDRRESGTAEFVFAYWAMRTGHRQVVADDTRLRRIGNRLREAGGDPRDLLYAVDGAIRDDWTMGRDPKTNGKRYDGIQTVFRDRGKVEELAALCPGWAAGTQHPKAAEIAALAESNGHLGANDGSIRTDVQAMAAGDQRGIHAG